MQYVRNTTLGAEGLRLHATYSMELKIYGRQHCIFVLVKSIPPHLGHRQQTHEISSNLVMATREGTSI